MALCPVLSGFAKKAKMPVAKIQYQTILSVQINYANDKLPKHKLTLKQLLQLKCKSFTF